MAGTPEVIEQYFDVDKLSSEIFRILESKFLFGYEQDSKLFVNESSPETLSQPAISDGKVQILSIDAVTDCLLAAACLARLESYLRSRSGDPTCRIADFFDVAAGSGTGGVLAAMLFTRGPDGRSLFSAEEALCFLAKNGSSFVAERKGTFRGIFHRSGDGIFRRIFGDATLRDTLKPVLIPCYDLSSGAPFLFSRADAMETDGYDFSTREVCAATCAIEKAVEMKSIDGRTRIAAIGGGLGMANPTAAAITHVLHNKKEFPFAAGVHDLLVVSIAGVDAGRSSSSTAEMLRIAGHGMADTVDQAIAMAFSHNRTSNNCNYVRLKALEGTKALNKTSVRDAKKMMAMADEMLEQRSVESVLFQGKRLSQETNAQKLEHFSGELIKEHNKRKKSPIPIVLIKQTMTPRISSATTVTSTSTNTGSAAPSTATIGSP